MVGKGHRSHGGQKTYKPCRQRLCGSFIEKKGVGTERKRKKRKDQSPSPKEQQESQSRNRWSLSLKGSFASAYRLYSDTVT